MMYRMVLAILALTAVTASNADHSELMEKQKILDEKLEKQLIIIQNQIDHLDWYFKVGYANKG